MSGAFRCTQVADYTLCKGSIEDILSFAKRCAPPSSLPSSPSLKEAAAPGDGYRLIHNPFAYAKVVIDPPGDFFVVARDTLRLETVFRPIPSVSNRKRCQANQCGTPELGRPLVGRVGICEVWKDSRQAGGALHAGEEGRDC